MEEWPNFERKSQMLLSQFEHRFPTEESCVEYFKSVRIQQGVKCAKCGVTTTKWLKGRKSFQCTQCGCNIPLTKGTVMEHSKLSIKTWLYTMHLMTSIKQVLSAKEVQHQLGADEYPPVWLMMMKLRNIMGKREAIYKLAGEVEVDEAFFPIRLPEEAKGVPLKRGAGSQQQAKVLVVVESKPVDAVLKAYLERDTNDGNLKAERLRKKARNETIAKVVRYIKMFVIEGLAAEDIDKFMKRHVDKDTTVISDGSTSHVNFKDLFKKHLSYPEYDVDEVVKTTLPWVHVVIGRCRDGITAIHGEIDRQFLQLYLNEFCWKFNRRFFRDSNDPKYDLFDRLVKISALYTSDVKWRNYIQPEEEIL